MIEDLFYDYLAWEFAEEAQYQQIEYVCPECNESLWQDVETYKIYCLDCMEQYEEVPLQAE